MSKFPVNPISVLPPGDSEYDLAIFALGFERRASAIANVIQAKTGLAFGFDHNKTHSYASNFSLFREKGYEVFLDLNNKDFSAVFYRTLCEALTKELAHTTTRVFSVCIDVSSFDRYRLAEMVSTISNLAKRDTFRGKLEIAFLYSIAKFIPPRPVQGRNEFAGPVHRSFAGRFADPGRPLALIAGLGYEMGKVMGAAEYLQASRVISFFPDSPVEQFEPEVAKANASLLDSLRPEDKLHYPISDPYRTIATLDAVTRGLDEHYNIVMLPGGPKIFAVACLVLQRHYPRVSIWRVSSGKSIAAHDVETSNTIVGFRWSPEQNYVT